jgi:hypothetical protein
MSGAIPPLHRYVFMAWCLFKHRDSFTFTFYRNSLCSTHEKVIMTGKMGSIWGKVLLTCFKMLSRKLFRRMETTIKVCQDSLPRTRSRGWGGGPFGYTRTLGTSNLNGSVHFNNSSYHNNGWNMAKLMGEELLSRRTQIFVRGIMSVA